VNPVRLATPERIADAIPVGSVRNFQLTCGAATAVRRRIFRQCLISI
jgi:hypothetical protein